MSLESLDPVMVVMGSWATELLALVLLQGMATRRLGREAHSDPRLVWAWLFVVRSFIMLTLLVLALMSSGASRASVELPRDVSALPTERLLEWLRSERALVDRTQAILGATLLYLALQAIVAGRLRPVRRSIAGSVSPG
jgi:hypothetical protein